MNVPTRLRVAGLALALALIQGGSAWAMPVQGVLAGVITAGPGVGAPISLTVGFQAVSSGQGFAIVSAADAAMVRRGATTLLTVPGYVMDGSAAPGLVTYGVDPADGRFDLSLAYNFEMRAPMSEQIQSHLTLSGSAPVPLLSASGAIDPGFFASFTGSGAASTVTSGLTFAGAPQFYQTSSGFGFAVGVPEPSSIALLAGALAVMLAAVASAPRRGRVASRRAGG